MPQFPPWHATGSATSSERFWLSSHVRACRLDDQVVLLDLRRDRYLAVSLHAWDAWVQPVENVLPNSDALASSTPSSHSVFTDESKARWAEPLLAQGLLTRVPTPMRLAQLQLPSASVGSPLHAESSGLRMRSAWHFAMAASWSMLALRIHSLSTISERVSQWGQRMAPGPSAARNGIDLPPELHEAVTRFDTLRPVLITSRDRCLLDSLALVVYLLRLGWRAQWVIGVQAAPFAAHSWAQWGAVVLNDLPEHVRRYRPILVV